MATDYYRSFGPARKPSELDINGFPNTRRCGGKSYLPMTTSGIKIRVLLDSYCFAFWCASSHAEALVNVASATLCTDGADENSGISPSTNVG